MPLTAKFSKDFYDRFGHKATDELVDFLNQFDATYRAGLQELNEQNSARLEAHLDRRTAELQARIDLLTGRLELLSGKVDAMVTQDHLGSALGQMRELISTSRADTMTAIATARADMIKWMFVFMVTGVLAVLGLG
jgi:t-SNARE complex subunit (syntaxin)